MLQAEASRPAQSPARSNIQDMLGLSGRPGLTSLALGLPAEELMPSAKLERAFRLVLRSDPLALQYAAPLAALREHVVALMRRRGVSCRTSNVFVTAGAQQGIQLLTGMLIGQRGGKVLVEDRAYSGFVQALAPHAPTILTVPSDLDTGIDVEAVEALLRRGERPAFLYAMSDGHNPLGVSMSAEKRERLVALARAYEMPILEDDAYGLLTYERNTLPPLRALDAEQVLYVGSFSKIVAPALRVGWVVAPEDVVARLENAKEASDINTATLSQRALCVYLDRENLDARLEELTREYRLRRDAMIRGLREYFPSDARWSVPAAGMFVWVEMPSNVDTAAWLRHAIDAARVTFLPESAFWVPGAPRRGNGLRLSFSHCDAATIGDVVQRLASSLQTLP